MAYYCLSIYQIKNHDLILKYKFIVLDLTQYRVYASCGKAVIGQYLLPKVMQHLLEIASRGEPSMYKQLFEITKKVYVCKLTDIREIIMVYPLQDP